MLVSSVPFFPGLPCPLLSSSVISYWIPYFQVLSPQSIPSTDKVKSTETGNQGSPWSGVSLSPQPFALSLLYGLNGTLTMSCDFSTSALWSPIPPAQPLLPPHQLHSKKCSTSQDELAHANLLTLHCLRRDHDVNAHKLVLKTCPAFIKYSVNVSFYLFNKLFFRRQRKLPPLSWHFTLAPQKKR